MAALTPMASAAAGASAGLASSAAVGMSAVSANVSAFSSSPAQTYGVGLGGSGFLLVYYIGVLEALVRLGVIDTSTKTAGVSGGTLAAVAFNSGYSLDALYEETLANSLQCRSLTALFTCPPFSATSQLRAELASHQDATTYQRCRGTTYIGVSRQYNLASRQFQMISDFTSNEDLVGAALASTHIPAYGDGAVAYTYRGAAYNDGAMTNWLPCPPTQRCIRVSAIPAGTRISVPGLGALATVPDTDIDPSKFGGSRYPTLQLIAYLTGPAPRDVLVYMRGKGRADAQAWAKQQGLA